MVMTDVEGSTQLWEQGSAAADEAIALHDSILRGMLPGYFGFEVRWTSGWQLCDIRVSSGHDGGVVAEKLPSDICMPPFSQSSRRHLPRGTERTLLCRPCIRCLLLALQLRLCRPLGPQLFTRLQPGLPAAGDYRG